MLLLYFFIYQFLQIAAIPFVVTYFIRRKLQKKTLLGNTAHRLGFVPQSQAEGKKVIWIHAVSVGETLAIQSFINELKKDPSCYVYLTSGTSSGYKIACKHIGADKISYLPFDFLITLMVAFYRIKPSVLILVEAELWPNLLMLSRLKKLKIFLLNARILLKSKKRYFSLKYLYRFLFNLFDHIYAQNEDHKKLFLPLGIKEEKVSVMGNIKAFNVLKKQELALVNQKVPSTFKAAHSLLIPAKPVLLAGSIHPGEIDYYLNLYKKLKENGHETKLILAPRHFHWQEILENKVASIENSFAVWDEKSIRITRKPHEIPKAETIIQKREIENPSLLVHYLLQSTDIVIICVMGKLFEIYRCADIFFLGGTFVPVGGHNLLEPCAWSKPSIIGPYYENCYDCANPLEKKGALIKVKNPEELFKEVEFLIKNPTSLHTMGNSAYHWLSQEAQEVKLNLDDLIYKVTSPANTEQRF